MDSGPRRRSGVHARADARTGGRAPGRAAVDHGARDARHAVLAARLGRPAQPDARDRADRVADGADGVPEYDDDFGLVARAGGVSVDGGGADHDGGDDEQFLRAFTWNGAELSPTFDIDFRAEKLGRPHLMRFGQEGFWAGLERPGETEVAFRP